MSFLSDFFRKQRNMSIEEVVGFYMKLGFFGKGDPKSTAEKIVAQYQEEWGDSPDPRKPWDDVFMLALDEERVWQGDPECDVSEGNNVYTETLREWSRISQGVFQPESIEEVWESEKGPISVNLTLAGTRHTLRPEWDNDWLDLNILTPINKLIAKGGKHLACASDVNFAIVFPIDQQARKQLTSVRSFPFVL